MKHDNWHLCCLRRHIFDSGSLKWRDYEHNTIYEEFSSLQVFTIWIGQKEYKVKIPPFLSGGFLDSAWAAFNYAGAYPCVRDFFWEKWPAVPGVYPEWTASVCIFFLCDKGGLKSISNNSSMIKKVYVPKYIYVVSSVISNFITFLISLIVLVAVGAVLKVQPTVYMLQAVVPLAILLVFTMGLSLILSTLNVFFGILNISGLFWQC